MENVRVLVESRIDNGWKALALSSDLRSREDFAPAHELRTVSASFASMVYSDRGISTTDGIPADFSQPDLFEEPYCLDPCYFTLHDVVTFPWGSAYAADAEPLLNPEHKHRTALSTCHADLSRFHKIARSRISRDFRTVRFVVWQEGF